MQSRARALSVTYLVEEAHTPWGGVQTVLREADALFERGHDVTVLCRSPRPSWHEPLCRFIEVPDFDAGRIPASDLVVGTWCPTVPWAWRAGRGRAVHYCQGFEGDNPGHASELWLIERVYRLPGVHHLAIAPFLAERLRQRFGISPQVVPYGVREELFHPGAPRPRRGPLRVGLIGPWDVGWKDIPTGVFGARLAHESGIDLELVRVSPCPPTPEEREAWGDMCVEWHESIPLVEMPDIYRSLDVFLGTSNGGAEGFFLPAIEAMACGVPCVLSDIACFRDYAAQQDYARFFAAGDHRELADSIATLGSSPAQRERLREAGLRTAARHTFTAHVDGIEAAFAEIAANGDSRPGLTAEGRLSVLHFDLCEAAAAAHSSGANDAAMRAARAATELLPESSDGWQLRGRLELAANRLDAAVTALRTAAELEPRSASVHEILARALGAAGRIEEALDGFRRAESLGMPGALPLVGQARCLLALGRLHELPPILERACANGGDDPEVRALLQGLGELVGRCREEALVAG